MTTTVLVVSHLAAFTLGVLTFWAATLREGHVLKEQSEADMSENDEESEEDREHKKLPRSTVIAIVGIVVACFMVGFGVQQTQFQRNAHHDDKQRQVFIDCLNKWGNELTDTLISRSSENLRLSDAKAALGKAQKRHDDASDAVFLDLVTAVRTVPTGAPAPKSLVDKFKADLLAFGKAQAAVAPAQAAVDKAQHAVDAIQKKHPFKPPVLNCKD